MRPLHSIMYFKIVDLVTAYGSCSFIGSDIKGNTIVPESELSNSYEDQSSYFFEKYSKDLLVEVKEPFRKVDPNQNIPDHDSSADQLAGPQSRHWASSWIHGWEKFCVLILCPVIGFLPLPEYLQVEQPIMSNCPWTIS